MPQEKRGKVNVGNIFSPLLTLLTFRNHQHYEVKRKKWKERMKRHREASKGFENFHMKIVKCGGKGIVAFQMLTLHQKNIPLLLSATSFKVIYHQHNHLWMFY